MPRQPIDAEHLLWWAISRTGRLPWEGTRPTTLAFDRGLTARPRSRPIVSWAVAEACAGMRLGSSPAPAPIMRPIGDAATVVAEIRRLDPRNAAIVLACARAKIRPDWMPGVEPYQVAERQRSRKKHRRVTIMVWKPCDPSAVAAAREAYMRWHETASRFIGMELERWYVTGLAAPFAPWEQQEVVA